MDSKAFIDKFISYVEGEPVIWDKKNELHSNANSQNSAWEHIATKLNESNEGGYVTGECLAKLWASLTEVHEEYINNPSAISFEYVLEMKFLGKLKKEELFFFKIKEKQAFLKHMMANVVLLAIYIFMASNDGFRGTTNCTDTHGMLLVLWCICTGLASLVACWTISRNTQLRKNLLPIVIVSIYFGICILFVFIRSVQISMWNDRDCSETFSVSTMAFLGFPISAIISLKYHFVKITNKTSLISSLKTIIAAYVGSALVYIFLITNINWNVSFFLFVVWMIVNAKFSIDALCLSWKKSNIEPKNRYTVFWNTSTDQFEIVLNGSNPNHLTDLLVVDNTEDNIKK